MANAYVYKITNKITNQFYFGFRFANKSLNLSPKDDLWKVYFTSSSYVHELIDKLGIGSFETEIVFDHQDEHVCFIHEQSLIKKNVGNSLMMNKKYFIIKGDECKECYFCGEHTEETKKKISEILLRPETKEKSEQTFLKKYGVTHNSKIPGLRKKQKSKEKETLLERYGVDHNMKIPGVLEQMIENRDAVMMGKYGTTIALHVPEILEKQQKNLKKSLMAKYGVENPLQIPEVLAKQQETYRQNMEAKYGKGVYCPAHIKTQCTCCGKEISVTHRRFHFENCKHQQKDNKNV